MKQDEAKRIGLEYVPILYFNTDVDNNPYKICQKLIDKIEAREIESCLGGAIEGIGRYRLWQVSY